MKYHNKGGSNYQKEIQLTDIAENGWQSVVWFTMKPME